MSDPNDTTEHPWELTLTGKAPTGTFNQLATIFKTGFATAAVFNKPTFAFRMTDADAKKLAKSLAPMINAGHVIGPHPAGQPGAAIAPAPATPAASAKDTAGARWNTNPAAPLAQPIGAGTPAPPVPTPVAVDPPGTPEVKAEVKFTPGNTPDNLLHALRDNPQLGDPTPIRTPTHGTPVAPLPPPITDPNVAPQHTGSLPPQVTVGAPGSTSQQIETRLPPGPSQITYPAGYTPPNAPKPEAIEPLASGDHVSDQPIDGPKSAIVGPTANFLAQGDLAAAGGLDMYVFAKLSALRGERIGRDAKRDRHIKLGAMSERVYRVRWVADLTVTGGKVWLVERRFEPEKTLGRKVNWADAIDLIIAEERSLVGAPAAPTALVAPGDPPRVLPNAVAPPTEPVVVPTPAMAVPDAQPTATPVEGASAVVVTSEERQKALEMLMFAAADRPAGAPVPTAAAPTPTLPQEVQALQRMVMQLVKHMEAQAATIDQLLAASASAPAVLPDAPTPVVQPPEPTEPTQGIAFQGIDPA